MFDGDMQKLTALPWMVLLMEVLVSLTMRLPISASLDSDWRVPRHVHVTAMVHGHLMLPQCVWQVSQFCTLHM